MAKQKIEKYGCRWDADLCDLEIEMGCIRHNVGKGAAFHYEQMRKLLWPKLDDHRWHQLIRDTIIANKCVVLAGCASSGKTHEAAWLFLCEYFIYPEETCVLVSSTDIRGLRGRIWSEMTMLWQEAKDKYDWLPGNLLDSRISILTDALDEEEFDKRARNYRKCIQGVPCRESGQFVGLNRYAGWKQKRMRLIADEASQMAGEYISGITNLNSNPDFKVVILGNFADPMDCLGRCSEPKDGWSAHMAPMKTQVWDTFFPLEGKCINLIGFDSPNFDFPKKSPEEKDHYPYMIGPKRISEIEKSFGRESIEFMSQCWGAMKVSTLSFRVLTREICEKGKAFDDCSWSGGKRIQVAFLDSAWGGDRAVFTWAEFGTIVTGETILRLNPPEIVPFNPSPGQEADYAIAEWLKNRCESLEIPPDNFFHDSTGRGTLGTVLARVWSAQCNPVEFGGKPTQRPVSLDYWWYDPKTNQRRIKLASEHYGKFVTELWFSFRYAVESGQIRNLMPEVLEEFSMRVWRRIQNDGVDVEPKSGTTTKPGMKQRTGRSPDLADSAAGVLEGARRRGFQISKLSNAESESRSLEWLKKLSVEQHQQEREKQLDYEAA